MKIIDDVTQEVVILYTIYYEYLVMAFNCRQGGRHYGEHANSKPIQYRCLV